MLSLGKLRICRFPLVRTGLTTAWAPDSVIRFVATTKTVKKKQKHTVDSLMVEDPGTFASAIVSMLKPSDIIEQSTALKEMRSNPHIESKEMGSLLKASDVYTNWFKQWIQNVMGGSYAKLFPALIPLQTKKMLDEKARLAAAMFMIKSIGTTPWIESQSEEGVRSAVEIQSSELADEVGNNIQLNRLTKLTDILVNYSEGKYESSAHCVNDIKSNMDYFIDYCEPILNFINFELPHDWKVLVHLQKEKRKSVIAELQNDISLLASRNSSGVFVEEHQQPAAAAAAPSAGVLKVKKYCLKPNGQALRFNLNMKCYSLTSYKDKTHPYGFHSLLEKNRNLYDPNWQNQSHIMYKVNKDFTTSPSSSLLDFLDGPAANLSTRKSIIEREAEIIDARLKKQEEDQSLISEVETSLMGNVPSFLVRNDSEVFSRRVIIDNLPTNITEETIRTALSRCGGVSECHLFLESSRPMFSSVVPPEMTVSRVQTEIMKREEALQAQIQKVRDAQERALREMPDEYFKNGKLKPKKLPKIKMDVPSVSGRLNQRKKLLEEERNGNYAVLTMDSEESFGYVTRAAIKLFGICIGDHLCKVVPVTEFKKFTVQVGDMLDVKAATQLINDTLIGEFECHISSSHVSDTARSLYVTLEFDSHEEGWSAFERLYTAYKTRNQPLYPAWIESPQYHTMLKRAVAQKTFIRLDLPQGVVVDDSEVRVEVQRPSSSSSDQQMETSYSLSSYVDHSEMTGSGTAGGEEQPKKKNVGKIKLDKKKKNAKAGDEKSTTEALFDKSTSSHSLEDASGVVVADEQLSAQQQQHQQQTTTA